MNLSSKQIADYIYDKMQENAFVKVDNAIISALDIFDMENKLSLMQKSVYADEHLDQIKKHIKERIVSDINEGLIPRMDFGENPNILINKRAGLKTLFPQYEKWLSELSPSDFEKTCKVLLECEGCSNVVVTPPSGDGGIDFYGTRKIEETTTEYPTVFSNAEVLVIGQAKLYSSNVPVDHIRSLIGSFKLSKISEYKKAPAVLPHPISSDSFKPLAPIFYVFVTTGKISNNVKQLSNWLGIKIIDKNKIIDILYSNSKGIRKNGEILEFDAANILA